MTRIASKSLPTFWNTRTADLHLIFFRKLFQGDLRCHDVWSHTVTYFSWYWYCTYINPHDPPCVLHHVFGKKTPHDLGPSSSKRTIRMPECCASAKNGGSPTHLSSTPHLWATKKFGFRKLLFCIVESAWIAQKKIVGLTMVSKSIFFLCCHTTIYIENESVVSHFFWRIPTSLSIQLFKVRSYGYSHDLNLGTFREAFGRHKTHGNPPSFKPLGWQSN